MHTLINEMFHLKYHHNSKMHTSINKMLHLSHSHNYEMHTSLNETFHLRCSHNHKMNISLNKSFHLSHSHNFKMYTSRNQMLLKSFTRSQWDVHLRHSHHYKTHTPQHFHEKSSLKKMFTWLLNVNVNALWPQDSDWTEVHFVTLLTPIANSSSSVSISFLLATDN